MYEQIARNKRRAVLYLVVFFLLWAGVGAAVGALTAAMTGPRANQGNGADYLGDVVTGVVIAALAALLAIAVALRSGAGLVLSVSGARPADPERYRQLHNLVEALAIGEGIPKPAVYVIDDPSPNAFATGTSPRRAAITVTTGLLALMNRAELEGVLGQRSHAPSRRGWGSGRAAASARRRSATRPPASGSVRGRGCCSRAPRPAPGRRPAPRRRFLRS